MFSRSGKDQAFASVAGPSGPAALTGLPAGGVKIDAALAQAAALATASLTGAASAPAQPAGG